MIVAAHAKVNLGLWVLGKRPDDYHEILTVMHEIALCDTLTITPSEELSLVVEGRAPKRGNLVLEAVRALSRATAREIRVAVHLKKKIPPRAGLGGGSSDAAATLVTCNRLLSLNLGDDDLEDIAGELGTDVPFFIRGGAAVARGRGELLERLEPLANPAVSLSIPKFPTSTKTAYTSLEERDFTPAARAEEGVERVLAWMRDGTPPPYHNTFERAAFAAHPSLVRARDRLLAEGMEIAGLCGSGSSVFGMRKGRAVK